MTEIHLNDIKSVMSIIDVCTQRGAFKSEEMENVGRLYNKFKLFVNKSIEQIEATLPKPPDEPQKENLSSDDNGGQSMEFDEIKTI